MTKYSQWTVVLAVLLSALIPGVASAATATPPKVVFIGDQFTYMWGNTAPFAANKPNWVNKGWASSVSNCCNGGLSGSTEARFQSDVVSQHPAIVHIMVGSDDLASDDDAIMVFGIASNYMTSLQQMVTMAKAANIKVILGLEPLAWASEQPPYSQQLNAIVAAYGAQNNIPVVNYGDALCGCVGSTGGPAYGAGYDLPTLGAGPTPAGYALMTQMAEVAILNTLGQQPGGGYLQIRPAVKCCHPFGPAPKQCQYRRARVSTPVHSLRLVQQWAGGTICE
jgi:GDSL-like Lipase/Acylhydrolase family